MNTNSIDSKKLDSRVRRVAAHAGLVARKSRRALSVDNDGQYRLVDPFHNNIVAGEKYDLSAEDVIEFCAE